MKKDKFDDYREMARELTEWAGYHDSDRMKDLCWELRYLNPMEPVLNWIKEDEYLMVGQPK